VTTLSALSPVYSPIASLSDSEYGSGYPRTPRAATPANIASTAGGVPQRLVLSLKSTDIDPVSPA